jgi:hypothetical protein
MAPAGMTETNVTVRAPGTRLQLDADHFKRRLLQDCLSQGLADRWLGRAESLEAARPRPGDFTGRATEAELEARSSELSQAALARRRDAWLLAQELPAYVVDKIALVVAQAAA